MNDRSARGPGKGADQEARWADYYRELYSVGPAPWLDLSNEAVQAQTFAIAIEAAGAIEGRRCLDVGSGHGQLATGLSGLRAGEVVGIDIVRGTVESCRVRYPQVRWECGSPSDAPFIRSLGDFDIIFLVEVLQYVDPGATLRTLWDSVRPGGRIVAVVPNREDMIVQRTISRFDGTYRPPGPSDLVTLAASLHAVECWAHRGMDFQEDQRLVPYLAGPWTTSGVLQEPANRLVFAIRKRGRSEASTV